MASTPVNHRFLPEISLVIPAYNEANYLPRLLDTIDAARDRFAGGRDQIEVIVADNGSTDDTAAIAGARGCRVATVSKRIIGASRNGGAAIATAPILCFCDADMQIHPDTFNAVAKAIANPKIAGGATGVTLERWSVGIALTFSAIIPLVWATGMDTGVVYMRRADFEALGGYSETRHFAEDVAFFFRLLKLGRSRGQHLHRLRRFKAIASVRKFDKYGDWHYFWMMPKLTFGMLKPHSSDHPTARKYWYEDR